MALSKLGLYIKQLDTRNASGLLGEDSVVGISTQKEIIATKADLLGVSLTSYKLFPPMSFAYVPDTSRRGEKVALAFNMSETTYLVSSIYVVFRVQNAETLVPWYLFMYFNRPEFDRYARFNSWGSARETFNWEDMCDIDIDLPPLPVQQKYVDFYKGMLANQKSYERGLEDLKLTCDAYVENLDGCMSKELGAYIKRNTKRNSDGHFAKSDVRGFNNNGQFIKPMRLFSGEVETFKVISRGDFVYNSRVNSTIERLSIVFNEGNDVIVTPAYETFSVKDENALYPFYLYYLLQRDSFAKKVLFNSFGSATTFFGFDDLCEIDIPVPNINEQKRIAEIYRAYKERQTINERLKAQIKDICPILIKGSLEEGG